MGAMQMPKVSATSYSVNISAATVESYWCLPGPRSYINQLQVNVLEFLT